MINFEKTEVWGFEHALRGMRNPLNSWHKSDSAYKNEKHAIIGENDLKLAQRLCRAGSEHRKFMRQIFVSVDISAPLYWWKEADTYKVGTVANSCSTMHKIHEKEFTLDDFSCEHLVHTYSLERIIKDLNFWRGAFLIKDDDERVEYISKRFDSAYNNVILSKKDCWWQMIQLLPSSYNQKRTVTMNYENLYAMYRQRKHHKLNEWSIGFVNWIETLPYAKELIICEDN